MTIDKQHAQVKASVWQAMAQSGADLSAVPQEEQEKLVNGITKNLLVVMDSVLDDLKIDEDEVDEFGEDILWQGRPFLSITERYILTNERLKIIRGIVGRDVENFELIRVQDIDLKQNVGERVLGLGDITIAGADSSQATVQMRNIKNPEAVYEILRRAWLEARKRHGLQFREYM